MSKHISRKERWTQYRNDEYACVDGIVCKDDTNGYKTWVALFQEGKQLKVIGRGFKRARNAMMCVEESAKRKKQDEVDSMPPIRFRAHIFDGKNGNFSI